MAMNPRLLKPTASGFTPRSISGLALWLDASDGATLFQNSDGTVPATASSDPVGYWGDKSGNGRHAVQATAGLRPTLGTLGSKNALSFAGNAIATQSYAAKATSTYVYVGRHDDSADTFFQTGPTNGFHSHLVEATSKFRRNEAAAKGVVLGTNVGVGVDSLWCVDFSNDAISVRHNGVTYGTTLTASETTISDSSRATTLGRLAAAETYAQLNGRIAEFMVYGGRNLTASERGRLERFLAAKYGITLAPQVSNADAQDWINRVYANGGTVSSATAAAVNQLCDSLESASLRDRFYRLNLFCGSNLNAALVPLYRGPSLGGTQYGGTTDTNNAFVGIGTDYAETGATGGLLGNGTTKYLNTGFNVDQLPGAANCHLSSFITGTQDIASARTLVGVLFNGVTDRYRLFLQLSGSTAPNYGIQTELGKANSAAATNRTNTNGGLILASRTSTTLLTLYDDAVSIGTTETSTAEVTGASPFFVFARNGPTEYYNGQMAAYSIGAGMTAAQVTAYNTAIQAFQNAMGRV